jgi:hypothetical protein
MGVRPFSAAATVAILAAGVAAMVRARRRAAVAVWKLAAFVQHEAGACVGQWARYPAVLPLVGWAPFATHDGERYPSRRREA